MATNISKKKDLDLTLRSTKTIFVENEKIKVDGLRAKFRNHIAKVEDGSELEKGLDKLLTGEHARVWSIRFQKKPSDRVLKKFDETAKKIKKARDEIIQEVAEKTKPEDQKAMEDFKKFTAKLKKSPEVVTGMRDVNR